MTNPSRTPASPQPPPLSHQPPEGIAIESLDDISELDYLTPERLDRGIIIELPNLHTSIIVAVIVILVAMLLALVVGLVALLAWLFVITGIAIFWQATLERSSWTLRLCRDGVWVEDLCHRVHVPWTLVDSKRLLHRGTGMNIPLSREADLHQGVILLRDLRGSSSGLQTVKPPYLSTYAAPRSSQERLIRDVFKRLRDKFAARADATPTLADIWPSVPADRPGRDCLLHLSRLPADYLFHYAGYLRAPIAWLAWRGKKPQPMRQLAEPIVTDWADTPVELRRLLGNWVDGDFASTQMVQRVALQESPDLLEIVQISRDHQVIRTFACTLVQQRRRILQVMVQTMHYSRLADGSWICGSHVPVLYPAAGETVIDLRLESLSEMLAAHRRYVMDKARDRDSEPAAIGLPDLMTLTAARVEQRFAAGLYTPAD